MCTSQPTPTAAWPPSCDEAAAALARSARGSALLCKGGVHTRIILMHGLAHACTHGPHTRTRSLPHVRARMALHTRRPCWACVYGLTRTRTRPSHAHTHTLTASHALAHGLARRPCWTKWGCARRTAACCARRSSTAAAGAGAHGPLAAGPGAAGTVCSWWVHWAAWCWREWQFGSGWLWPACRAGTALRTADCVCVRACVQMVRDKPVRAHTHTCPHGTVCAKQNYVLRTHAHAGGA